MKRLHKYLIRSYIGPLIMTFCLAMIVLILQFVWKWIDELVGKGLSWSVIAELLTYVSAKLLPMALILAVLLASIMTFGNLGEHSELSALKSSGISITRIMMPLLVLAGLLTFGAFLFSNYTIPETNKKFYALLLDIRQQRPEFDIKEGQFYNGLDGVSLKIGKRSRSGKMLYDLMIYDHRARAGNVGVTVADSGQMVMTEDKKNLILTLYNGNSYSEYLDTNKRIDKNRKFQRTTFASQQLLFQLPGDSLKRTDEEIYKDNYMMKNMEGLISYSHELRIDMNRKRERVAKDLITTQYFRLEDKKEEPTPLTDEQNILAAKRIDIEKWYDSLPPVNRADVASHALMLAKGAQNMVNNSLETSKSDLRWINRHMIEWHRKLTLSIACLIFFLIGAPLGSIIRKGGLGTPVVVSTLFFIFYYIISLAGEKYARAGILPVWLGMWGSSILLLPLGIFLTVKTTRDSALMVGESYTILIRKILSFGRRLGLARNEDPPAVQ